MSRWSITLVLLAGLGVIAYVAFDVLVGGGLSSSPTAPGVEGGGGPAPPPAVPPVQPRVRKRAERGAEKHRVVRHPRPKPLMSLSAIKKLQDAGELTQALHEADRVVAAEPDDAKARELRGGIQMALGWYRGAEKDFRRAIAIGKPEPDQLDADAVALIRLDRLADAKKQLDAAMKIDPKHARTHSVLALLLVQQKQTKAARSQVDRALLLDPEDSLAQRLSLELRPR